MSAQQVQEAASPNLGIFRRFSRSTGTTGKSSSSSMTPNGVHAFWDVVADNASATSLPTVKTRPTAFRKLKSQLGRRGKKTGGTIVEQKEPGVANVEGAGSAQESEATRKEAIVESTSNATVSQTTPSSDTDEVQASGDANSNMKPLPEPEVDNPSTDDSQIMSGATLARRIHEILSSFPPFYTHNDSGSLRVPKSSDSPQDSTPNPVTPLADTKLLSLLSSASIMNGSISKGRESVWAILERLGYSPTTKSQSQAGSTNESDASSRNDDNVEVSSVMICCPLQPTDDTEVEIARSEIVSMDMEEEETVYEPTSAETPKEQKSGLIVWPFGKGKGKGKSNAGSSQVLEQPKPPSAKIKEVRVWYPSRSKVSLQAAWWGYRIYLPPPVMRVLSDKTLEAAKRAAMITAALTWLVSHIPTTMLPPQLRAVVGVVKGIVPIIGYVGGFIAWSWNTVQGFDKGQGVILSATWLLPIALVPGTWFYTEPPEHSTSDTHVYSPDF